jgi:hypothetical protein
MSNAILNIETEILDLNLSLFETVDHHYQNQIMRPERISVSGNPFGYVSSLFFSRE